VASVTFDSGGDGNGTVGIINDIYVNNNGDWIADVNVSGGSVSRALIRNGQVWAKPGDAIDPDDEISSVANALKHMNSAGDVAWRPGLAENHSGMYLNFTPLILRNEISAWPGFGDLDLGQADKGEIDAPARRFTLGDGALDALERGDAAPEFALPGTDEKTYALSDFSDARAVLVVAAADGSSVMQITDESMDRDLPSWSPWADWEWIATARAPNTRMPPTGVSASIPRQSSIWASRNPTNRGPTV
jgi:hypothetical protein